MKQKKNRKGYGQRWPAETGFSLHKRVLGVALRGCRWVARHAEMLTRILAHNLLLLASP